MGAAKEQEIRLMGFVLLAAVVVGMVVATFLAVRASEILRSPAPNASVSQSSAGSSLGGVLGQG